MHMTCPLDGYRGIWFTLGQFDEYGDKYSGGLGTYTAKHVPLAIHAPAVNRTFFVFGGAKQDLQRHLLAMVGCYDHQTRRVSRPFCVHDKQGVDDPHDNPSLALDDAGHLWVFVSGRGTRRPGFKYRSRRPYEIDDFELIREEEFTYPQPWYVQGHGFLHLFTRYTGVRQLYFNTSPDGRTWTEVKPLALLNGHYQTSRLCGERVITAFNYHPHGRPDERTNLYYLQTDDMGETWHIAAGDKVSIPIKEVGHPALIRNYQSEGKLVYMKDIGFDREGHPVILHVVSDDHRAGPAGGPRVWRIACWRGGEWVFHDITSSEHNYDTGSLDLSDDRLWRLTAPTQPGPQRWGTGGEVAQWTSVDRGRTWTQTATLTAHSPRNHAYVRRPIDAHHDFAWFWADGNPDELSISRLYFADLDGRHVWQLPEHMDDDWQSPIPVKTR